MTLSNNGDIAGVFTVDSTVTSDVPGPLGGVLSGKLDLKVDDMGPAGAGPAVNVYDGKLDAHAEQGARQLGGRRDRTCTASP